MPSSSISSRQPRFGLAFAVVALVASVLPLVASTPASAAIDPCGPSGNEITCENSKAGSPNEEWDILGPGDDSIQGFSTDISVNAGSSIGFKIDTDASAYTIDVYRIGYYGGDGARKITSITPSASLPQHQPACITDVTTELYDCGNWALSASWNVPSNAVSGVYIAKLQRNDTGGRSHITFIVRKDSSTSDVVFQTSDPTWQAYNTYGGSDFYEGAANGRAYKISYNRPVLTRGGIGGRDFFFSNEYPMVRFLEKNGYDTTYISGVDTDRHGGNLTNHKVFLSVGHDEYWSGAQRANVEAARDAGVNLQFLSGNEVYWRTRYENSADASHTPYRTLVSYKETWGLAKIDPSTQWTGTYRDPRYASTASGAGSPENALTGTAYMVNYADLAMKVPADEGKNRLWRNTSVASQASGATATLAPHTVGYESNEDVDNGFRPAGLIRLSKTTGAAPEYLQDFGNTVAAGTTTHHLTLYRAASGALVFSAGTVQWTWGLDGEHDSAFDAEPADVRMQQAQVNLFADMGVQPATLASGLTAATKSTDTAAPSVTITSPAANAAVANGASVTVTGTATDTGGGRVAGVEVSTDGGTSWRAATGTTSWSYTYLQKGSGSVPVRVRAIDDSANIGTAVSRSLTVSCPCSVFGQEVPGTPTNDDNGAVELGLRITAQADGFIRGVRFYKGTKNTGTHTGSLWSTSGERLATGTFTGETATGWQTLTFSTPVAVSAGQEFVASYSAPNGGYASQVSPFGYRGIDSGPLKVQGGFGAAPVGVYGALGTFPNLSWQNTNYYVDAVFSSVDESPLTAGAQWPLAGSGSVPLTTTVRATLSKPATNVSVTLKDALGQSVAGTTSYNASTRVATFTPAAALNGFVTYTATVAGTDAQGNSVTSGGSWTFTTVKPDPAPGVCPCSLYSESLVPSILEDTDTAAVTLGVRFSSSVAGTITGVKFYKGPNNTGSHTGALWSSDGTKLAEGTFTGETTWGWQTLTFSSPVTISKNTEYVASYRTTVGRYSATLNAFPVTNTPLTGVSGAYTYGTGFPSSQSAASYLVDVVFERAPAAVAIASQDPAPGALGVARDASIQTTFSSPISSGYQLSVKAGSTTIAGAVSLEGDGTRLVFDPSANLPSDTLITVTLSNVTGTNGASLATTTWTFRTTSEELDAVQTLFGDELPAVADADDGSPVELGMTFTPTKKGKITGVRFFKGAGNTGSHVGSLWSSNGTRLASVAFSNETATGWQTAKFSTPVSVTAGTEYVVSYYAPRGHYAVTGNYFAQAKTSGDLTAPAATNGRYLYAEGGGMPVYSYNATNYFVDVTFVPYVATIAVSSRAPAAGATGVARTTSPSITFDAPLASGYAMTVSNGATPVAGTVALSSDARTLTFTPAATLPASTALTVAVTGITSQEGASLANQSWSFTTAAPSIAVSSRAPAAGATSVDRSIAPSITFDTALASGYAMTVSAGTTAVSGSVALSNGSRTLTFTPAAKLGGSTTYTVRVTGIKSTENATLADQTWTFTTAAIPTADYSFLTGLTPSTANAINIIPTEVGMAFTTSKAGQALGVKFYKGSSNTGTHTGTLWTSGGTKLATVTFTGETSSGWQTANFASPVALSPGTTYVVSYWCPTGRYSYTNSYFGTQRTAGPMSALTSSNGRYRSLTTGLPSTNGSGRNYFVDIIGRFPTE